MVWDVYQGKMDAATHLAIDDKLFEKAKQGQHSLLFPEYIGDSIVLSKHQHVSDYLGNGNPGYTRRITPGGAMLCSKNTLPFTIAVPKTINNQKHLEHPKNTHEYFGGIIKQVLESFGVKDMELGIEHAIKIKNGSKPLPIMGTSQRREENAYLYHGVITIDPWDANYLNDTIKLRSQGEQREYDKIKELPYVRAYNSLASDELKESIRKQLAEQIAGTQEIQKIPSELVKAAEEIVEKVYHNDQWRKNAQHPTRDRLTGSNLRSGLGFCLLGDEPF